MFKFFYYARAYKMILESERIWAKKNSTCADMGRLSPNGLGVSLKLNCIKIYSDLSEMERSV